MVGHIFKIEAVVIILMVVTTGRSGTFTAAAHQEISQSTQCQQAATTVECHLGDVHALFFHRRGFHHRRGNLNRRRFHHRLGHHHIGGLLRLADTHIGQSGRSRRFGNCVASHRRNGRLLFLRLLLNRWLGRLLRLSWLLRLCLLLRLLWLWLRRLNRRCGGRRRRNRRSRLGFHLRLLACRSGICCRAFFLCSSAYAARRIVCQTAQGIAVRDGKGSAAIHQIWVAVTESTRVGSHQGVDGLTQSHTGRFNTLRNIHQQFAIFNLIAFPTNLHWCFASVGSATVPSRFSGMATARLSFSSAFMA